MWVIKKLVELIIFITGKSNREEKEKRRVRKKDKIQIGIEEERVRVSGREMTQNQLQTLMQSGQILGSLSFNGSLSQEEEEMSKSALSTFRAKEEEIEKKKLEVRERVQAQMGRIEEETKRLASIREELEALADPMKKEIGVVRKKINVVNKELKPLGQTCQKKMINSTFRLPQETDQSTKKMQAQLDLDFNLFQEKEYKDALDAFNEKNKEKVQLITRLMELVSESLRMKKLDELSKSIETTH